MKRMKHIFLLSLLLIVFVKAYGDDSPISTKRLLGFTSQSVSQAKTSRKPADSQGGGSSSGGNAHTYRPNGPACFLGKDKVIKACVVMAPNFEVRASEAAETLQTAFHSWASYVKNAGLQNDGYNVPFATDVSIQESCDGTEDLKILLGVTNDAEANQIKEQYPQPWGFENCTHFDSNPLWGKSLIWIAPGKSVDGTNPNWRAKNRLLSVLLREIGRLYGNGVVDGTIMREDITRYLSFFDGQSSDPVMDSYIASIDQDRVLYRGQQYEESVSATADERFQYRWGFSFKKLIGRDAKGPIHEDLQIKGDKTGNVTAKLSLSDGQGAATPFKLSLHTTSCFGTGENIFYRNLPSVAGNSVNSAGCALAGELTTPSGKKHPVQMITDSETYRYELILTDEPDFYKAEVFTYAPYAYPMKVNPTTGVWESGPGIR